LKKIVRQQVEASLPVDALDSSLPKAKEVQSLRAMFNEKYPDPVRVVTVGAKVEDLIKDPKNPKWMDYSVEFCGGTHLRNSNEIKDFAITEEEGVSKGVRRLVALTFDKARDSIALGKKLIFELETICTTFEKKSLLTSQEVGQAISIFTPIIEKAIIPLESRETLNKLLAKLSNQDLGLKKSQEKVFVKQAEEEGSRLGKEFAAKPFAVIALEVGALQKALTSAQTAFSLEAKTTAVLFVSAENKDSGKLSLLAYVPASLHSKLKASEWVNITAQVCGGKGGGKADLANGAARDCSGNFQKTLTAARTYAISKLEK